MSEYLVVTHETALSPDLQRRVSALIAQHPRAAFAALVPQTPGAPSSWEGCHIDGAQQREEGPKALLEENAHAQVVHTAVGDQEPLQAITDELRAHPGYDTLVICTLPPGISRWLKLDLVHRAERKFHLPVIHVVAEALAPSRR